MSNIHYENELLDEPTSRLEKPIELKDLFEKCADFAIRNPDAGEIDKVEETDISQVYSMEELEPYCLTDVLEAASDDENDDCPNYDEISRSFPLFRKKMFNLTEDGQVMKMVGHESHDEKVPSEGYIVVYYHYAAYVELVETPYDCSRLRQKKPVSTTLGKDEVIPGLEIALRSMRRGEKSKFLVHPGLAYREEGQPPRIPPNATILFDVDLIDFCTDVKEEYVRTRDRTFAECLELAQKFRANGNSLKKREKNINGAISAYKKGLQILIEAVFNNDEDELVRKKEMLHLYTNLAVCYLEKNRPRMVCNMYNDATDDCSPLSENHPKLLYSSGKALRILGSYDESLRRLRKALRLKPDDQSVLRELNSTLDARQKHKEEEKRRCKQMFGFVDPTDQKTTEDEEALLREVGSDFVKSMNETMDFMEECGRQSETLNATCYTYEERRFIRQLCSKRNFLFRTPSENTIVIIKRSVPK